MFSFEQNFAACIGFTIDMHRKKTEHFFCSLLLKKSFEKKNTTFLNKWPNPHLQNYMHEKKNLKVKKKNRTIKKSAANQKRKKIMLCFLTKN